MLINQIISNSGTSLVQGTSNPITFNPDLIWIADRVTGGGAKWLFDSVRGSDNYLQSNSAGAEGTRTFTINSDGVSIPAGDGSYNCQDGVGGPYVHLGFGVSCSAPPACIDPAGLSVANVTSSSADLVWVDSLASSWNIEWDTIGFALGTGIQVNGTATNPYNVTGLTPNTKYEFYVQADCGMDSSAWIGPFSFITNCITFTVPWIESFDGSTTLLFNCKP